jgi:hypothetical protein
MPIVRNRFYIVGNKSCTRCCIYQEFCMVDTGLGTVQRTLADEPSLHQDNICRTICA